MSPVGVDTFASFFFRPAGRITRQEYALGLGFVFALSLAGLSLLLAGGAPALVVVAMSVLWFPFLVAELVLIAKRCHDIGLPGIYLVLVFVPFLGLAWLVALALIPGNPGPNAYGPAPHFAAVPGET
ncbi:MAG: DUF805 domain-containing protein [Bauldia sp.]|nr:DUF805 domain-containing protein [Bauldia sp.]